MLPFGARVPQQQFGQMMPTHENCDTVPSPLNSVSSKPDLPNVCDTDSVSSERAAPEHRMPEEFPHQQYSTTFDWTQSWAFNPFSHGGTNSASDTDSISSERAVPGLRMPEEFPHQHYSTTFDCTQPWAFNPFSHGGTDSASDTDSFSSERKARPLRMPEEHPHQQYSTAYDCTQSPALDSFGHDETDLASLRDGSSSSEPTANPSQAAYNADNPNVIRDLVTSETWEGALETVPQKVQQSERHTHNKLDTIFNNQCPVCNQTFRRRDNIKPHMRRKHPMQFASLYAMSRSSSPQSFLAPTTRHQSTSSEAPSFASPSHGRIVTSPKTPGQVQRGSSHPRIGMVPQKRSLSSISQENITVSSDPNRPPVPSLISGSNGRGRSLACPFQKRDPSQHQRCFALSLQRIKDVKQHVYRCHTKPDYYCASCYQIFNTPDERDIHSRLRGCNRLDTPRFPQFEGITDDQRNRLKEKSPRTMDVEQQWFQIWSIVFPDQRPPRSPYLGDSLEEMVPILRARWDRQRSSIVARAGGMGSQQLSRAMDSAMDMFFESLETGGYVTPAYGMSND